MSKVKSKAIAELRVMTPPCQQYLCDLEAKCKAERLACQSFLTYVITGRVYMPTAKFSHFPSPRLDGYGDDPEPTHQLWKQIKEV